MIAMSAVQLVKAQTVIGSGGSLTLRDLQGDEVEADKRYTLRKTERWSPRVIMDSASRPHQVMVCTLTMG
ncbi:lipoprotein/autotransporter domain-containing protein [Escherichia coli]|uniref:Lipoprotein/autotransporter domain-containing protein n=1 Tax=Escherichia coli TaxID=562 RepID=A0A377BBX8_ECOLX|nr:lipoprotein/autotransporter domain-containing protein [Escherichia coli]